MQKTAVIFGGTGFIGRNIVKDLAKQGVQIKVATRTPESGYFLKTSGNVGQITPVTCDLRDYDEIANLIQGADFVINCLGILYEQGQSTFEFLHTDVAESIASACAVAKVKRFVHISALGVNTATSKYAKSKLEGEKKVLNSFAKATILRPSIVFGIDDNFFNRFAKMSQTMPFLPLIGGGNTKFQPVYVGDVKQAVTKALFAAETGANSPLGQVYELGGPDVLSFKDIYQKLFSYTQIVKPLLSMPFCAAKLQAFFLGLLPSPILTMDQVESLKTDNIVGKKAKRLSDLGIKATSLDVVLPSYLITYRPGGRFAD